MAEMRDDAGNLYRNKYKKEDRHPDYRGKSLIGGVQYEVSAWINEGRNGKEAYLGLRYKVIEDDGTAPSPHGADDPFMQRTPLASETAGVAAQQYARQSTRAAEPQQARLPVEGYDAPGSMDPDDDIPF